VARSVNSEQSTNTGRRGRGKGKGSKSKKEIDLSEKLKSELCLFEKKISDAFDRVKERNQELDEKISELCSSFSKWGTSRPICC